MKHAVEWHDVMVIANLDMFGGSIRKAVKAHYDSGLLPRTSTLNAHCVRIGRCIKEIRAASKSNVVALAAYRRK